MIDERQVREMLERRAETISAMPTDSPKAIRRARRRLARNATVVAVMALAVVAGAAAAGLRMTQATPPPVKPATPPPATAGSGALAYALDGDIYVADSDGANPVRIADGRSVSECGGNGEYWTVGPMWSPDGRYLAYRRQNCPLPSEEDPSGVVISDLEGNVVAEVSSAEFGQNVGNWRIAWSPDSTRFATWVTYVDVAAPAGTPVPAGETIGVFGLDGARHALLSVRPFTDTEFFEVEPMWLPDGESLLVGDLVVPIDGRTPHRLQLDGSPAGGVTYSPDGSRLAYVHEVDAPGQNTLVVEGDPAGPQAVFVGAEGGVVWSPTGDRIAFTSRKAGADHLNELRVVDLDTGTVTLLADWSDREPEYFQTLWLHDFSPEGDRILFGVLEGNGSLWSVNVDGSDLRRLVSGTYWGDWLPPGAQLAASVEPSASVDPSPDMQPPFTERFDSRLHGLSIDYPSGWQTRAATEPWRGGELAFGAPDVDVIFHPTLRDDLYFAVVSEPLGGRSGPDWVGADLPPSLAICARDVGSDYIGTDYTLRGEGAYGMFISCGSPVAGGHFVQVATATRGYIIHLHVADDPRLQATYDREWFEAALETVDLRPEDA